jgi:disulfide bond formation protein DsbB
VTLSRRPANFSGALVCGLLLGYAYYLQYVEHLEPCPLCIFQRVAVFALGLVFLVAALHNPQRAGARVYSVLLALVAAGGIAVAARHVYIQSLPPGQVPACGATLDYMLEVFPLTQVIRTVLTGSGECGVVDWQFLGLSMPWWVLICLVLLGIFGCATNWAVAAGTPRSQRRFEPYIG